MSEETKKTPQTEEPAVEPNTAEQAAPETAPEQAAAPETNAEAADPKKKDGFFNKKARELEAVKAKLDAAEKNANQAKDQLLRMAAEYENYRIDEGLGVLVAPCGVEADGADLLLPFHRVDGKLPLGGGGADEAGASHDHENTGGHQRRQDQQQRAAAQQ